VRAGSREPAPVAIVGLEVELPHVKDKLATEIAQVQSATESRVAVIDETGTLFVGDEELAGPAGRGLGRSLSDALPGWRVVAVPRDPGAPERLARNQRIVSGLLVATCALAAALSFVVALRATSRELEVARVRNDLVRNVSHELRTPVASVLMLSEVLEEGGLPQEKQADYVTRIAREARRLSRLIENVLDLARVERGARKVELRALPLGETIAQAVAGFRESEEGRDATVLVSDPEPEAPVAHDPAALEQVLQNLISNAVKYSPAGAPVRVAVTYGPTDVRLSVEDQGRGLGAEEQRRLFAPFYRARPEDGSATGVGLGLVITRELVRLHGGRLELASAVGKGSTFTVVLPKRA
jgi:signal transduction histidine kinase